MCWCGVWACGCVYSLNDRWIELVGGCVKGRHMSHSWFHGLSSLTQLDTGFEQLNNIFVHNLSAKWTN